MENFGKKIDSIKGFTLTPSFGVTRKRGGFSLIELLVVISIIALLGSIVFVALGDTRKKARDTKRKSDLSQIGRFILASECYMPDGGAGDYDFKDLVAELVVKYPQYANFSSSLPIDPKSGNDTISNYRYEVTLDKHCVIYANFENENEEITLSSLTAPAPNAGTGILNATNPGPNGTTIYYQVSK